jgi:hypothetical protein
MSTDRLTAAETVIAEARKLVDAIQMDDTGMMVGTIWQGGNGGLLSTETIQQTDRTRKALEAWDAEPPTTGAA